MAGFQRGGLLLPVAASDHIRVRVLAPDPRLLQQLRRHLRLGVRGHLHLHAVHRALHVGVRPGGHLLQHEPPTQPHLRRAHLRHGPRHGARDFQRVGRQHRFVLARVRRVGAQRCRGYRDVPHAGDVREGRRDVREPGDGVGDVRAHLRGLHARRHLPGIVRHRILQADGAHAHGERAYDRGELGDDRTLLRIRHGGSHGALRHRGYPVLRHRDGALHQAQPVGGLAAQHADHLQGARHARRDIHLHLHGRGDVPGASVVGHAALRHRGHRGVPGGARAERVPCDQGCEPVAQALAAHPRQAHLDDLGQRLARRHRVCPGVV
mmetsp:Transcript_15443/g.37400  ORF Transcript_15443/g.37400 Transcript_15443/m.37400 type:complete len:322 (-) Transcript_15443:194-1159(-)